MRLGDVLHMGGRGNHRVGQSELGIDPDVRLHAKVPLVAFLRLVHLGVALAVPVLRRAWRGDDRRINYRAFPEQQALLCQVGVDRRKDSLGQAVRFKQPTKLEQRRGIRGLAIEVNANEGTNGLTVVEAIFNAFVR